MIGMVTVKSYYRTQLTPRAEVEWRELGLENAKCKLQNAESSRVCGRKGSSDQVTRHVERGKPGPRLCWLPKPTNSYLPFKGRSLRETWSSRAYLPQQAAGSIKAEGWVLGKGISGRWNQKQKRDDLLFDPLPAYCLTPSPCS